MIETDVLASGSVVRGYRVLGRLGTGATAHTYEAEALEGGQRLALKRFRLRGAGSWKLLELFEREAGVLSQLSHDAIPRFVESFTEETAEGPIFYLVQSLVPGVSLERRVAEGGPLPGSEVRRIGARLLDVLVYLHTRPMPVIHRDIKPANVLVGPDGGVHLVDFGAVRQLAVGADGEGSTVSGTFGFMAPEQLRGSAVPATDLYGVGATLTFLLTGRSPDQLPQFRLRVVWPKDAHLDPALLAFLSRLLEPAPEDRFASAAAAHMALADLASAPATAAASATRNERAAGGSSRRTLVLASTLALVGSAAAGAVYFADELMPLPGEPAASAAPPALTDEQRELLLLPAPGRPRHAAKLLRHERGQGAVILDLAVSNDGTKLATASKDGSVKLWSTSTWTALGIVGPHEGPPSFVDFTTDDSAIITADAKKLQLFDASSRARTASVAPPFPLQTAAISFDRSFVLAGGTGGQLARFALPGLAASGELASPDKSPLYALGISPDGGALIGGSKSGAVSLLPLADGRPVPAVLRHAKTVNSVAFSPDGSTIASAGDDGVVHVSFASDGKQLHGFTVEGEAWSVAFSPDGSRLFVGDSAGGLRCFILPSGELSFFVPVQNRGISNLRVSADGQRLFLGTGGGAFLAYQLDDPKDAERVPRHRAEVGAAPSGAPATLAERAQRALESWPENGDALDEADALATEALEKNPKDALALTQRARVAMRRAYVSGKKYDPRGIARAQELIQQALVAEPRSVAALDASVGIELAASVAPGVDRLAALSSARAVVKRLSALPGNALRVECHEARIANELKEHDEAERLATHVLMESTDPTLVERAYLELQQVYLASGRMFAADQIYRRRLELDPKSAWSHGSYANFLLRRGMHKEALEQIDTALAYLAYPNARRTRANILADRGIGKLWDARDLEAARADFHLALKDEPKHPDGLIAADYFERTRSGGTCDDCVSRLAGLSKASPEHEPSKKALARLEGEK